MSSPPTALSGLEAAAELADAWPATAQHHKPFPALVFVTAYDQYAVQAFEAQAMDYLLKPVQFARLQKTVSKVHLALSIHAHVATKNIATSDANGLALEATLAQLRHLLAATSAALPAAIGSAGTASPAPLKHIQASVGSALRMVPVAEVVYFEAADKYVRVLTCAHEYLIRTPLKELLSQLDTRFWQIHRGAVVNADCIDIVTRDASGKLHVSLRGRPEKLPVSRLYAYLFKAM